MPEVNWDRIQEFFFAAMINGYATDSTPATGMYTPGHKSLTYSSGDLMLIDQWATHPDSDKSSGFTTICKDNQPIWIMSYEGHYPEKALPFLKAALNSTYQNKVFCGGRGPRIYSNNDLYYYNNYRNNEFTNFEGGEIIYRTDIYLGSHSYRGQSLV